MFLKHAFVAMALTMSAVLASVPAGTYIITTLVTGTNIRAGHLGEPIFEIPSNESGPNQEWQIMDGNEAGGQVIRSVGLNAYLEAPSITVGVPVMTAPGPPQMEFQISPAGDGTYTIQVANDDYFWTISGPAAPAHGLVYLLGADGSSSQKFALQLAPQ